MICTILFFGDYDQLQTCYINFATVVLRLVECQSVRLAGILKLKYYSILTLLTVCQRQAAERRISNLDDMEEVVCRCGLLRRNLYTPLTNQWVSIARELSRTLILRILLLIYRD